MTSELSTRNSLQEIQLSDIMQIKLVDNPHSVDATRNPHVFEIRLANMVYYVGEDPTCGGKEAAIVNSVESGVGLEQALHWEAAIRQALMPVTPQSSKSPESPGLKINKNRCMYMWLFIFTLRLSKLTTAAK